MRVGEAEISYFEEGQGDTVVLVPGGFADYRTWAGLSAALRAQYRVVSVSRRGYYPNRPAGGPQNVQLHSEDLAKLIAHVSKGPVHLVGESYGAHVALRLALRSPQMVRSLVIDEPTVLLLLTSQEDKRELDLFERRALNPALDFFAQGRPVDAARTIIDYLEGSNGVYDSLPEAVKAGVAANSDATYEDLKGGFGGVDSNELGTIQMPTLLLKSELGPRVLKRVVELLGEAIPDARMIEIKGTSHGSIVDSADYSASVLDFVTEAGRRLR